MRNYPVPHRKYLDKDGGEDMPTLIENIFSHEGQFEVYNNEQRLKELKAKYQNILERR